MARQHGAKNVSAVEREIILQTFAVTGKKTDTAREVGRSYQTVRRVIAEAEKEGRDLKEARADAAGKLASRMHIKAEELLESITPEDMESGRFATRNEDGKITGYKYFGPSLMQKATALGIITDKANVLQQYEKALVTDTSSGALMLPNDIETLAGAIRGKIKDLQLLNIRFEDDNLVRRTEEVVAEAEAIERNAEEDVVTWDNIDGSD